jgi:tetratricopeptide (TPR) repeat protein
LNLPLPIAMLLRLSMASKVVLALAASSPCLLSFLALVAQPVGLGMLAQQQRDYVEARRLYQQSLKIEEQLGNLAGQASSLGQLGMLDYEQGNFEQALTSMVQAFLLLEKLRAPDSALARRMIARIREQMDEATFLSRWRALAGDLPVPAPPQEPSQEEASSSMTLGDVLNAVVNALLHGTGKKREQLATFLVKTQQQLPPSEAALGKFLACLAAALHGETPDLRSLEAPFTEFWQQFQQALQTHGSEQDQQEPE